MFIKVCCTNDDVKEMYIDTEDVSAVSLYRDRNKCHGEVYMKSRAIFRIDEDSYKALLGYLRY